MKGPKRILIIQVCLLFFAASATALNEGSVPQDKIIETLEYLAHGYETNARSVRQVYVKGRIFHEQKAQEGRQVSESRIFAPRWLNFDYIKKDGKRRYEQDRLNMSNERQYALDNNKRLLTFATNIVRIYPLRDEESRWVQLTGQYGRFVQPYNVNGYENVGLAMRTLIEDIRAGKYEGKDWNISINVNEEDLFTIHLKRSISTEEYTIDSHKGFNLVKLKYFVPSEKFWRDKNGQYDYTQLETGGWTLTKGLIKGISNGVIFERRLETTDIQEDFEASDEIFESESLNIPADIYTVDHHFSPPLELNKGRSLNTEDIDSLLESDIGKTEIAQVNNKGEVTVGTHQAYVEHEARNAKKPVEAPIATSGGKWHWFVIVFALIVTIGGIVSALIYRRLKGQV
ncbi:MAG: hypothetical protein GWN00_26345 [Aliifodinibius sp.]|nr:hypothetical protein [Fodinibius sp.]NIV14374.1 hypothetical protein [Fodinibius sp.]NIY28193.1 hypothetical protein [Fodinibius sp.]